jgi:uncharacterized membrane protein
MNTPNGNEQKKLLRLYAAFGASLALSLVPSVAAAIITLLLFLGVLFVAYAMRKRSSEGSLIENHTTYIIRTIWISGAAAVFTLIAASVYMLQTVDNTPLDPCISTILSAGARTPDMATQQMIALFRPCFDTYLSVNLRDFIIGGIIAAGPVLLYIILRFTRGLARAGGGYRIANVRSWL